MQDLILRFVAIYTLYKIFGPISRSCGSQDFLKKSRWPHAVEAINIDMSAEVYKGSVTDSS